ncbi:MAG: type II toxin-antitoxin system RelE/ParE family toxin [Nanoarchaeota archaeon]
MYTLKFSEESYKAYLKFDKSVQERVKNKIQQLKEDYKKRRHLRLGKPYFVEEVGQYRIVYELLDKEVIVLFIGKHKDYEEYLKKH